jgi:hypothetical protein
MTSRRNISAESRRRVPCGVEERPASCEDFAAPHLTGPVEETDACRWVHRIRSEYWEMPGLSLTESQVERLWQLDAARARMLLDVLLDTGFLRCTSNGRYVRADGGGC